jgi:hypothetical protein
MHRALAVFDSMKDASLDSGTINSYAKLDHNYCKFVGALPLSSRAGIPGKAGTAQTAYILDGFDDELAAAARDPDKMLLPFDQWPQQPRKPFVYLDKSYPDLIAKSVAAGMNEYVDSSQLVHWLGEPRYGGGFAVPKDDAEDRWISPNEFTNDIICDELLPTMSVPYLPQLASTYIAPCDRALVSKRDARHYFHTLSAEEEWRKYMA